MSATPPASRTRAPGGSAIIAGARAAPPRPPGSPPGRPPPRSGPARRRRAPPRRAPQASSTSTIPGAGAAMGAAELPPSTGPPPPVTTSGARLGRSVAAPRSGRRQRCGRLASTPSARANCATLAPGGNAPLTSRSFSCASQRRRRPPSAIASTRRIAMRTATGIAMRTSPWLPHPHPKRQATPGRGLRSRARSVRRRCSMARSAHHAGACRFRRRGRDAPPEPRRARPQSCSPRPEPCRAASRARSRRWLRSRTIEGR